VSVGPRLGSEEAVELISAVERTYESTIYLQIRLHWSSRSAQASPSRRDAGIKGPVGPMIDSHGSASGKPSISTQIQANDD
jgi:hypothetical protein